MTPMVLAQVAKKEGLPTTEKEQIIRISGFGVRELCCGQDWLHNVWGTEQNEKRWPFV